MLFVSYTKDAEEKSRIFPNFQVTFTNLTTHMHVYCYNNKDDAKQTWQLFEQIPTLKELASSVCTVVCLPIAVFFIKNINLI